MQHIYLDKNWISGEKILLVFNIAVKTSFLCFRFFLVKNLLSIWQTANLSELSTEQRSRIKALRCWLDTAKDCSSRHQILTNTRSNIRSPRERNKQAVSEVRKRKSRQLRKLSDSDVKFLRLNRLKHR